MMFYVALAYILTVYVGVWAWAHSQLLMRLVRRVGGSKPQFPRLRRMIRSYTYRGRHRLIIPKHKGADEEWANTLRDMKAVR